MEKRSKEKEKEKEKLKKLAHRRSRSSDAEIQVPTGLFSSVNNSVEIAKEEQTTIKSELETIANNRMKISQNLNAPSKVLTSSADGGNDISNHQQRRRPLKRMRKSSLSVDEQSLKKLIEETPL